MQTKKGDSFVEEIGLSALLSAGGIAAVIGGHPLGWVMVGLAQTALLVSSIAQGVMMGQVAAADRISRAGERRPKMERVRL